MQLKSSLNLPWSDCCSLINLWCCHRMKYIDVDTQLFYKYLILCFYKDSQLESCAFVDLLYRSRKGWFLIVQKIPLEGKREILNIKHKKVKKKKQKKNNSKRKTSRKKEKLRYRTCESYSIKQWNRPVLLQCAMLSLYCFRLLNPVVCHFSQFFGLSVHFLLLFTAKKSSPEDCSDKCTECRTSILVIIMTLQLLRIIGGISCTKTP